jgi:hypothetical protein
MTVPLKVPAGATCDAGAEADGPGHWSGVEAVGAEVDPVEDDAAAAPGVEATEAATAMARGASTSAAQPRTRPDTGL